MNTVLLALPAFPALGLGVAAVTAAGAVWYLPALCVLRAGADRPSSARLAAGSCLLGWTTGAALAVLLLLGAGWPLIGTAGVLGGVGCGALAAGAGVWRRWERRDDVARWAALGVVWARPRRRLARSFVWRTWSGLLLAVAVATALLLYGEPSGARFAVAGAVAGTVVLGSLLVAVAGVHGDRRS